MGVTCDVGYEGVNNNISWNGIIWKAELKNRKNKEGE